MEYEELTFQTHDGLVLYAQGWLPDAAADPRAVLAIVHGIGEHCGRYMSLVNGLVPQNYAVWGVDLRGHGRSEGQRGHIDAWSDYRGDVIHFLEAVRSLLPHAPMFLFGHSMGSLVVLDYVLREPDAAAALAGVIISGAPFEPVGVANPVLIQVAKVFSKVWPRFSLSLGIRPEDVSCDPEDHIAFTADPLRHPQTSARWGTEALKTVAWVKARADQMRCPLLVVHGGDDPLNTAAGAAAWFEHVPCEDKALHIYPGNRHEVHNDFGREQLIADLAAWLADHLAPEAAATD